MFNITYINKNQELNSSISKEVDRYWDRYLEDRSDKLIFNGEIICTSKQLIKRKQIKVFSSDYKNYVYSKNTSKEIYALGAFAIIITADKHYMLICRSRFVDTYPNYFSLVGGGVNPKHFHSSSPYVGLLNCVKNELDEEVGLKESIFSNFEYKDFLLNKLDMTAQFYFTVETNLTAEALGKYIRLDPKEVSHVLFIHSNEVNNFLNGKPLSPVLKNILYRLDLSSSFDMIINNKSFLYN